MRANGGNSAASGSSQWQRVPGSGTRQGSGAAAQNKPPTVRNGPNIFNNNNRKNIGRHNSMNDPTHDED